MDISQIIEDAFPGSGQLSVQSDSEIGENANPMELSDSHDLFAMLPAYMQWVIRNRGNYDQLVTDWTLNALAEYGRARADAANNTNFMSLCSGAQRRAVCNFLQWSLSTLYGVQAQQIKRAMKNWC